MKRVIFISVFISVLLITGCNTKQVEQKDDAFSDLKWHDEFCDNVVGTYRLWWQSPVSVRHVDNKMMALDNPILDKNASKIYFRNQFNHYGDKPELDLGEFSYKIYKKADNQVAIELEDSFLEVLKEKIPKEYHYFGKYFVFDPMYWNLEEKGSKFEYSNCKLAIASCKTTHQVEKLLSSSNWYYNYREDGDCERERFSTDLEKY